MDLFVCVNECMIVINGIMIFVIAIFIYRLAHRERGKCTGTDPGFQVRGGALKKNSAERREARTFLVYFVWKITILRKKIIFFPILSLLYHQLNVLI